MSFFNKVAGLFKRAAPQAQTVQPGIPPPKVRSLREYAEDLVSNSFRGSGLYSATHRTSHRTVSMDLRDARKRRNIEKRKQK